jgi:hypothetical protein
MKVKSITNTVISLAVMTLFGCGGGGGDTAPAPLPAGTVTIAGVAAKGPLNGANVTVFAVKADGTFDRTLGPIATGKTSTDGTGRYSINIPAASAPKGPVVVEVTGGTYTDEVSGTANVQLTAPIRTVVPTVVFAVKADGTVEGKNEIAVTPFTELAFQKAVGTGSETGIGVISLTKTNIDDANSSIAKTFGIDNIVTTQPFDPANAAAASTATAAEKKYSVALGTISQMTVKAAAGTVNAATLSTETEKLLTNLGKEVFDSGGIKQASLDSFNSAVSTFNTSPKNQTGTTVPQITFSGGVLSISTSGVLGATNGVNNVINGIDMTLTLPAGVTVKANALGDASLATLPSSNAVNNSVVVAKYTAATQDAPGTVQIEILNVQPGFAAGEFLHINFQGFPTGLKTGDFKVAFNGDGIFGGVANGNNTAALPGISLSISDFVGL